MQSLGDGLTEDGAACAIALVLTCGAGVGVPPAQGAGYYPLLARRQGLALRNTTTVIGLHGPTLWAKVLGNQETIDKIGDLEMDWMERKSRALADYVVSPSAYLLRWMHENDWPASVTHRPGAPRVFVQPNILPLPDRAAAGEPLPQREVAVRELVFFGRLETRKVGRQLPPPFPTAWSLGSRACRCGAAVCALARRVVAAPAAADAHPCY